ncbi:MAG: hypothetical protein HY619_03015 [Thaumarchaeota archaeon]|nr:hypothetical protein [Nitrososphaerota archaeon]
MNSLIQASARKALRSSLLLGLVLTPLASVAQEDDYEFMPPHAWRILGETGEDDVTSILAEGFPGLRDEVGKNFSIEPVDGSGGLDNVAPRLSAEEGPGGLEFNPSPTYRTRYKGATDYPAGAGTRVQGNNWFMKIPYAIYDAGTNEYRVRFDANTFRVYTNLNSTTWLGKYGNANSKIVKVGTDLHLYDIGGKDYFFPSVYGLKCSSITGVGLSQITITYGGSSITVLQKDSGANDARRFTYTLSSDRIDKIDIEEKQGVNWYVYRRIDFSYFENVPGAAEGSTGDLIGVDEFTRTSFNPPACPGTNCCDNPSDPSTCTRNWIQRRWVFKYYTGTYDATTNPGYPYQVKSVLEPQSVRDFEKNNPSVNIYTQTTSQLASYVDRTYEYFSDKRLKKLDLKNGCGCGGGEGMHTYTWDINPSTPSDLNTWYRRCTITMPNGCSSIIDYNKYGQTFNSIAQQTAGDPNSRRWIRTWQRNTTGQLTDSYSVKTCTSYNDTTHVVTTNTTAGMRFIYAYDTNKALDNIVLRDPGNGNLNYQGKKVFNFLTSGDRRRFLRTSQTVYPTETADPNNGKTTTFSYTYHASDPLAVKLRTTTLAVIATTDNGSGYSVKLEDYFETDVRHSWHKMSHDHNNDGTPEEKQVDYTGYDANRRTPTKTVADVDTNQISPPDTTFNNPGGLHLVSNMTYDEQRRITKSESPSFNAWDGAAIVPTRTTRQWFYTKLSGGEFVVTEYPHLDAAYYHAAMGLTVFDFEGHVLTSALGELSSAKRDTNLNDDFDPGQATLESAFQGIIVQRTDNTYQGDKLIQTDVWSDADNPSATKFTTLHTYDATTGRLLKTTNPAGTKARYTYDVLDRIKTTEVGTDDGNPGNMTLVEELFYDDEEDSSSNVGDGNITQINRYTAQGSGVRTTQFTFDYRNRKTETIGPLAIKETYSYTNRNQVKITQSFDTTGGGNTLMAKSENFYDAWGQAFETRISGVSGGVENGYTNVKYWGNGRGQTVKTLSQAKIFNKTQYDKAGRVTNQAVSYDTAETAYTDADDLVGDTVIEETRYALDGVGGSELVASYQRRHNGTGTGGLTVGVTGNGRAQYIASWYDKLHRQRHGVTYGTNGGTDMTARPTGNPPSSSGPNEADPDYLVTKYSYTIKSQIEDVIDPQGFSHRTVYEDWGLEKKKIDNYKNGIPGDDPAPDPYPNDDDRTVEYTYDSVGRLWKITAKASGNDQVTENVYGVQRGVDNSQISSNDVVKTIKYPGGVDDQVTYGYNAQLETAWMKDQQGTEHGYVYDARGRIIHDRATILGTGIDATVRRITTTYDALDRPVKIRSVDNASLLIGNVLNEVQYEYEKFGVVKKIYQEWTGAVDSTPPGESPKVEYAYQFPTDGTTALRLTSTTYPGGTIIAEVYNSGTDDTISRVSGRQNGPSWVFQERYLGLSRLVEREYGSSGLVWTLISTTLDPENNDYYVGLDRFGRIDDLRVKDASTTHNRYLYSYNYNSQVTVREDDVGNQSGYKVFDEGYTYDDLGRLVDHKRGQYENGSWVSIFLHECFTLDRSGNITIYYNSTTSSCANPKYFTYNSSNEITFIDEIPYNYNKPGDMTDRGTTKDFVYDAWNRVVDVLNGSGYDARYKYNGLNQKIKRTNSVSGLADKYYYFSLGSQVLEEKRVSDSATLDWYVQGTQYIDDIVYRSSTGEHLALDTNFNLVTRFYAGSPQARYVYYSYGDPKQLSPDWNTWQTITDDLYLFTARQWQKDHAQYDFRNRHQDPELGVFTTRDPIGIWGDEGNFGNAYVYVGNDPGSRLDPLGYQAGMQFRRGPGRTRGRAGEPLVLGGDLQEQIEAWQGREWAFLTPQWHTGMAIPEPVPPPPPPPPQPQVQEEEYDERTDRTTQTDLEERPRYSTACWCYHTPAINSNIYEDIKCAPPGNIRCCVYSFSDGVLTCASFDGHTGRWPGTQGDGTDCILHECKAWAAAEEYYRFNPRGVGQALRGVDQFNRQQVVAEACGCCLKWHVHSAGATNVLRELVLRSPGRPIDQCGDVINYDPATMEQTGGRDPRTRSGR